MGKKIETVLTADSTQLRAEYARAEKANAAYEKKVSSSQGMARQAALANVRALALEASGRREAAEEMRRSISLQQEAARLSKATGISERGATVLLQKKLDLEQKIAAQKARAARIAGGRVGLPEVAMTSRDLNSAYFANEKFRESLKKGRRDTINAATGFNQLRGAIGYLAAAYVSYRAAAAVVVAPLKDFADIERLSLGLKSIEGSAAGAARRIEFLRQLASSPGLAFEPVLEGDIRLRSAGLSAEMSAAAIREFGNALASVGGGKEELAGVILALGQIASKGTVSAEEINQIAERLPQIRVLMQRAFGTSNTEDIQKMGIAAGEFISGIVKAAEDLPRAMGGAADSMLKLGDAWKNFKASLGQAIAIPAVPAMKEMTDVLDNLRKTAAGEDVDTGAIENFFNYFSGAGVVTEVSGFMNRLKKDQAAVNNLSAEGVEIKKQQAAEEQRILQAQEVQIRNSFFWLDLERKRGEEVKKQAAARRAATEALKEGNTELRDSITGELFNMQNAEKQIAGLKRLVEVSFRDVNFGAGLSVGNLDELNAAAKAARDRGDFQSERFLLEYLDQIFKAKQKIADLEKSQAESEEVRRRVKLEKEAAAAEKEAAEAEKRSGQEAAGRDFLGELTALRLEAAGRKEAADALREEIKNRKDAKSLAESMGITEQQALALVREREALERRIREGKERGERNDSRRSGIFKFSAEESAARQRARGGRAAFASERRGGLRGASFAREQAGIRRDEGGQDRAAASNFYDRSLAAQEALVRIFGKLGVV